MNDSLKKFKRVKKLLKKNIPNKLLQISRKLLKSSDAFRRREGVVLFLISKQGMRPGNLNSSTFGACTLKRKHFKVSGDCVTLKFVGKSNVKHVYQYKNKLLADALRQPWHSDTKLVCVKKYLDKKFKVKDLRTARAMTAYKNASGNEKEKIAVAAETIGNKPSTCKKHYLPPPPPPQTVVKTPNKKARTEKRIERSRKKKKKN